MKERKEKGQKQQAMTAVTRPALPLPSCVLIQHCPVETQCKPTRRRGFPGSRILKSKTTQVKLILIMSPYVRNIKLPKGFHMHFRVFSL